MPRLAFLLTGLAASVASAQAPPVPAPAPTGAKAVSAQPTPGKPAEDVPEVAPAPEKVPTEKGYDDAPMEMAPTVLDNPCESTSCDPGCDLACDEEEGWLSSFLNSPDPLLKDYRNVPMFDDPSCCDGSSWYYSVGGEFRYRYMDERNRLRPQGTLRKSNYHLTRFTPFIEVGNDWIKGYVRGIDAQITGHDIPFVAIDRNRWDLMEYYVDAKVGEIDGAPVRVRYGRQVLLFGDQHLVSPLGWANTFRTFEGTRGYVRGDTWDFDAFAVQASNGAARGIVFKPEQFDTKDESRWFSGVYATYKNAPKGQIDLFWLWFNENEPQANRADGDRHTIGARYAGKHVISECDEAIRTYFWDVSGGYQFGDDVFGNPVQQDVEAGFVSATAGITLDNVAWKPTLQGIFWYGSGDDTQNDGTINTYNSLYPLGHAYWGIIDNFSGQNLMDYAVQTKVSPSKKLSLVTAYHIFNKASSGDAIYNIVGAPLGPVGSDRHIGNELDMIATYKFNPNLQVQAGYSWFWYGDAVNTTALNRPDAKQFYLMTTLGF